MSLRTILYFSLGMLMLAGPSFSQMSFKNSANVEIMRLSQERRVGINTTNMKGWTNIELSSTTAFPVKVWNDATVQIQTLLDVRHVTDPASAERTWGIRSFTLKGNISSTATSRAAVLGHLYSSVVDGDGVGLLCQGDLGHADYEPVGAISEIHGVNGIVDADLATTQATVCSAIRGLARDNSANAPNVFSGYFLGAKSFFEKAVGIGTTAPVTGYRLDVQGASIRTSHNIWAEGRIGVGTSSPQYKLDVIGDIRATGSVYYGGTEGSANGNAYTKPDFVFEASYKPMNLEEVRDFIDANKHLPWITPAAEEKESINMTRMGFQTLEAVENLQLQNLALYEEIRELKKEIERLKTRAR